MSTTNPIYASVSEYYAGRINGAACCSPTDNGGGNDTAIELYELTELAAIPTEATQNSFGCGNPTAIAALQSGETVLDLGSGGGLDVFLAARQVGAQGFVYGVDMTDELLTLARKNAVQGGFDNVEFRKGNIESLPLDDQTVDVIISNCVINLSPDKRRTLHEAWRVLKPGGRLAVADIVIDGALDDLPVTEEQVRAALSWAGCIAGALTIDDYRQLLMDAGFQEITITIRQRYTLADLGQEPASVTATLAPEVAHRLVNRFVSAEIAAYRPQH